MDGDRFVEDLTYRLQEPVAFDAVVRVRCSPGMYRATSSRDDCRRRSYCIPALARTLPGRYVDETLAHTARRPARQYSVKILAVFV